MNRAGEASVDDKKGTGVGDGLTRTMDVIVIRDSRKSINDPGQPSCKPRPSAPAVLRYRGPSSTTRPESLPSPKPTAHGPAPIRNIFAASSTEIF